MQGLFVEKKHGQVQDSRIMRLIGKRRFTSNFLNGQVRVMKVLRETSR